MWVWVVVTNPAAGSEVMRGTADPSNVFSVIGICVSHNFTSPVTVRVQVIADATGEVAHYFDLVVPASSTFVLYSPDDTIISEIGREYFETLQVLAMTGGSYTLSVGLCIRGVPSGIWGRS